MLGRRCKNVIHFFVFAEYEHIIVLAIKLEYWGNIFGLKIDKVYFLMSWLY